jgi:phage gp16-like protein
MSKRRVERIHAKFASKIAGLEEQIRIRDAKDRKTEGVKAEVVKLTEELSLANEQIRALEQERAELLTVVEPLEPAERTEMLTPAEPPVE